jgi:hypothetical protein
LKILENFCFELLLEDTEYLEGDSLIGAGWQNLGDKFLWGFSTVEFVYGFMTGL